LSLVLPLLSARFFNRTSSYSRYLAMALSCNGAILQWRTLRSGSDSRFVAEPDRARLVAIWIAPSRFRHSLRQGHKQNRSRQRDPVKDDGEQSVLLCPATVLSIGVCVPEFSLCWDVLRFGETNGSGKVMIFRESGSRTAICAASCGSLLYRAGVPALENFMVKPNGRLVTVSFLHCCISTSVLSTWSSSTALQGDLILGKVSRLYAFSAYPNRTSLPSHASGETTGSQEVRSPRSSRTKGKPPQISYAHHR